ncbi:MAG TPA: FecR domain-containing protein [Polyangia bacterium]|nr:FecR domain-containing protein [Polyangia bacterium]
MKRDDQTRYAAAAARLLRRGRSEPMPSLPPDRRRLVDAVEEALAARARRRTTTRRWTVGFAAAAAAVALIAGGLALRHAGTPSPELAAPAPRGDSARTLMLLGEANHQGTAAFPDGIRPTPLTRGMILPAGIRLAAPGDGEVQIGTAAGTAMTLEKQASLTVTEASATQRFALHAGAVRVRVAPLLVGERFLIDTRDAEVEVHGTAFRVAVVPPDAGCADAERTRVTVSEGVVTVRSRADEVRLTPGSAWLSGCTTTPTAHQRRSETRGSDRPARVATRAPLSAPSTAPPSPTAQTVPAPRAAPDASGAPAVGPAVTPSLLAAQNNLFAAAVRAKNQGRAREAATLFGRLVSAYPQGPLVESAAAQRMKVLATADASAAADAATEYLQRFPAGFARAEAQRLRDRSRP